MNNPADYPAAEFVVLFLVLIERILFYNASRNEEQIRQINMRTVALQNEMWRYFQQVAAVHTTPVVSLTESAMNDVLNLRPIHRLRGGTGFRPKRGF